MTPSTRAIVLCSPCNPTGRVLSRDQADLLAGAARTARGEPVWLIHDEIYREQTYVDDAANLAERYPHTIVTNSVSKSNALTGLRLGWILGPQAFVEQAVKAHAWVTSCTDTFAQQVALHVFATPLGVREHAEWYADQRRHVLQALDEHALRYVADRRRVLRVRAFARRHEFARSRQRTHRAPRRPRDTRRRFRRLARRMVALELGCADRPRARRHLPHRPVLRFINAAVVGRTCVV